MESEILTNRTKIRAVSPFVFQFSQIFIHPCSSTKQGGLLLHLIMSRGGIEDAQNAYITLKAMRATVLMDNIIGLSP